MIKLCRYLIYLLVTISPLIFFTDLTVNAYSIQQVLIITILFLICFLAIAYDLVKGKPLLKKTDLDIPILVFLLVIFLSSLVSYIQNPGFRVAILNTGLQGVVCLLLGIITYYLGVSFADEGVLLAAFIAGGLVALYAIMQYFGFEPIWIIPMAIDEFGRGPLSTLGNPWFVSSYLLILLPAGFYYFLKADRLKKLLIGFIIIDYIASLVCLLRWSTWAGFIFMVLFLPIAVIRNNLIASGNRRKVILLLGAIVAVIAFFPDKNLSRGYKPLMINKIYHNLSQKSLTELVGKKRLLAWDTSLLVIKDAPVTGKGVGCLEIFSPFYQPRLLNYESYRKYFTHINIAYNKVVQVLAETGIIGFLIFIWLVISIFRMGFRMADNYPEKKLFVFATLGAIGGVLIDNLFYSSLEFMIPAFFFWLEIGIISGINGKEIGGTLHNVNSKVIGVVLLVISAFLLSRNWRNFIGEIFYFRGYKLSYYHKIKESIPNYELAWRYNKALAQIPYLLGNSYFLQGDTVRAIRAYQEALRLNPGYYEIYYNLGAAESKIGLIEEAISSLEKSLVINPFEKSVYQKLADIYMSNLAKYSSQAKRLFHQAITIYPEEPDYWRKLGLILLRDGNRDEANRCFVKTGELQKKENSENKDENK